jgi:hypothetical protein
MTLLSVFTERNHNKKDGHLRMETHRRMMPGREPTTSRDLVLLHDEKREQSNKSTVISHMHHYLDPILVSFKRPTI